MLPPVIARLEGRPELLDDDMSWWTTNRRIAFVTPRFGAEIVGGAEAVVRDIALGLAKRGWEVQILTTCAVNPYTWANELPEGAQEDSGLLVRRFANVLATSASEEHRVHGNIYYGQPTIARRAGDVAERAVPDAGDVRGVAQGAGQFRRRCFCALPVLEHHGMHAHRGRSGRGYAVPARRDLRPSRRHAPRPVTAGIGVVPVRPRTRPGPQHGAGYPQPQCGRRRHGRPEAVRP